MTRVTRDEYSRKPHPLQTSTFTRIRPETLKHLVSSELERPPPPPLPLTPPPPPPPATSTTGSHVLKIPHQLPCQVVNRRVLQNLKCMKNIKRKKSHGLLFVVERVQWSNKNHDESNCCLENLNSVSPPYDENYLNQKTEPSL